jgi:hypothetical protein
MNFWRISRKFVISGGEAHSYEQNWLTSIEPPTNEYLGTHPITPIVDYELRLDPLRAKFSFALN